MARLFTVLALALALVSCDSGMPAEHLDFAKRVVSMVQARDENGLRTVSDPALWQKLTPEVRTQMAGFFPTGEQPSNINVVSWKATPNAVGTSDVLMVLGYKYASRELRVTLGFRAAGDRNMLTMIYVQPVGKPPQQEETTPPPDQVAEDESANEAPAPARRTHARRHRGPSRAAAAEQSASGDEDEDTSSEEAMADEETSDEGMSDEETSDEAMSEEETTDEAMSEEDTSEETNAEEASSGGHDYAEHAWYREEYEYRAHSSSSYRSSYGAAYSYQGYVSDGRYPQNYPESFPYPYPDQDP